MTPTPTPVGPVLQGTFLFPIVSYSDINSQALKIVEDPTLLTSSGVTYRMTVVETVEHDPEVLVDCESFSYEEGSEYSIDGKYTSTLWLRIAFDFSEVYEKMLGWGLEKMSMHLFPQGELLSGETVEPATPTSGASVGSLTKDGGIESSHLVTD